MTVRAAFSAEEWALLCSLDVEVGNMMQRAAPGGWLRESRALERAMAEAKALFPDSALIAAISGRQPGDDSAGEARPMAVGDLPLDSGAAVLARCEDAIAILRQKASAQDVADYQRYLYHLAERVAASVKEGGFFGIGGEQISPEERGQLEELRRALGMAPEAG